MSKMSPKRFDPAKSPFHLLFVMDGRFMAKEFDTMEELAKFVKSMGLTWRDYGIIHGETVKEMPDCAEEVDEDGLEEGPESGITVLDPDEAQELAEQEQ